MQIIKKHRNRLVAAALAVGFPLAFAVDLTGLPLHQWLGVLVSILAAYHLILHWGWCRTVTGRLLRELPWRTRCCWLLDAGLLAGFVVILATGLATSTWRAVVPAGFNLASSLHRTASYLSLGLLIIKMAVKLAAGSRRTARPARVVRRPVGIEPSAQGSRACANDGLLPEWAAVLLTRRQALSLIGIAGLSASLAIQTLRFDDASSAVASPAIRTLPATPPIEPARLAIGDPKPYPRRPRTDGMPAPAAAAGESAEPAAGPAAASAPLATAVLSGPLSGSVQAAGACTVRCGKRCVYPGRCRRYADDNRNGLCDLGECL
jgi:hypothetical protein